MSDEIRAMVIITAANELAVGDVYQHGKDKNRLFRVVSHFGGNGVLSEAADREPRQTFSTVFPSSHAVYLCQRWYESTEPKLDKRLVTKVT